MSASIRKAVCAEGTERRKRLQRPHVAGGAGLCALLARRRLPLWSVPWQVFNRAKCMAQTSQHAPEVSLPASWSLFAGHLTLHCSPLLHGNAQETSEDVSPQDKLETEENMRGFIIFFSVKKTWPCWLHIEVPEVTDLFCRMVFSFLVFKDL